MSVDTEQPLGPGLDPEEAQPPGPSPGQSVLEYVKEVQAQIAEEEREPLTLAIPEWNGALAVVFEYPEQGATPIIRAGFRMQRMQPEKAVDAGLDVILGAAVAIVGKRPGDDDWKPIDPSGEPTRIGAKLANMLGIEVPTGVKRANRFIARNLWSPKAAKNGKYEGDIALVNQAGEVTEWLRGVEAAGEEDFEGE